MSLPNIPNITPLISLDTCDTINLLLSSIALEEIGLSHILNAEGEKLQLFLKKRSCHLEDMLTINNSVNKTLKTIVKSQMMLLLELDDTVELAEQSACFTHSRPGKGRPSCHCECKDNYKAIHCDLGHKTHCQNCSYYCRSQNKDS